MRSKISLLMMSIVLVLSSMACSPTGITVTDCTNFTGAGTISQAIADANNGGGTISVTCTGTIIFEDELIITADVVLNNDSGGEVIFDGTGNDDSRFFVVGMSEFTLNGFTLQNSGSQAIGNTGILTINNSTFIGNSAEYGGAIENDGILTVSNSTFTSNSANSSGGAIANGGNLTITNSTFTDNSASSGGGAIVNGGRLTIRDSTFTGNSAERAGGAIYDIGMTSSQDTHYENNSCYGTITDNGGNTVTDAPDCPGN